jgi:hypothetical protein
VQTLLVKKKIEYIRIVSFDFVIFDKMHLHASTHFNNIYTNVIVWIRKLWYEKDSQNCSILQVYNEQIRDLLIGGKSLPVREDSQNGVVVPGLSLHKVHIIY